VNPVMRRKDLQEQNRLLKLVSGLLIGILLYQGCARPLLPGKNAENGPVFLPADSGNNAWFPEVSLQVPMELEIEYRTSSAPGALLAAQGNWLFVPTEDGRLECYDMRQKRRLYRRKLPNGSPGYAIPAGKLLILALRFGQESILAWREGQPKAAWKLNFHGVTAFPQLYGSLLFAASLQKGLGAVDVRKGVLKWTRTFKGQVWHPPAAVDSLIVVGTDCGEVIALVGQTGKTLWEKSRFPPVVAPIVTDGSRIVICTADSGLTVLAPDGRTLWGKHLPSVVFRAPVIWEGKIVLAGQDGMVRALAADSGKQLWVYPTDTVVGTSLAATDKFLLFGTLDRRLVMLDEKGNLRFELKVHGRVRTAPLFWKSRLVFGSEDRSIYILKGTDYDAGNGENR
jgi:outer membrane protein assembly factor BamB